MNNINKITIFKNTYKKYIEAEQYLKKNVDQLKQDNVKWEKIQENFKTKFQEPLDRAWEDLELIDKCRFETLYNLRRMTADKDMQEINKIVEMFHGKIVRIELNESRRVPKNADEETIRDDTPAGRRPDTQ